ncbi:hypothetical protein, partial [Komagataeibacter xylinus]|uniref:hypothetical protein n=1 Tax=Komagataeibacter xylinus TaxID=28448 RepID=UPI001A92EAFB
EALHMAFESYLETSKKHNSQQALKKLLIGIVCSEKRVLPAYLCSAKKMHGICRKTKEIRTIVLLCNNIK